jgi:acid phosphatase
MVRRHGGASWGWVRVALALGAAGCGEGATAPGGDVTGTATQTSLAADAARPDAGLSQGCPDGAAADDDGGICSSLAATDKGMSAINRPRANRYVFVVTMENESAAAIYGNARAPYINGTLLVKGAHGSNFTDPLPDSIPSEPHYVWMEAGTNAFSDSTFSTDLDPSASNSTASAAHLVTQMMNAAPPVSWLSIQEGLDASTGLCPIHSSRFYAAKHDPFVFFRDIAGSPPSATNTLCADHHRAFAPDTFAQALAAKTVAQYNLVTPDLCHDMHGNSKCPSSDDIGEGDRWLAANLPPMIDFVNAEGGVVFVVWDEPQGGSSVNLIPFIAIGPNIKPGHDSSVHYTHGSLTKSLEEIYGLPVLGTVQQNNDFADLFQPGSFP